MLLGFKRRFAPFVEEGSKTHTIRGMRKIPPRVGETCHCYADPRLKTMRLLGRWPCVRIQEIRIVEDLEHPDGLYRFGRFRVWIDGLELACDEKNAFAWADGFRKFDQRRAFEEMIRYWTGLARNPSPLLFEGQIIHWRYTAARGVAA